MPVIAPWLQSHPRDVVAAAESGASRGQADRFQRDRMIMEGNRLAQSAASDQQQLQFAAQKLAQEEKLATMQAQATAEQQQRNFLADQQRNNITQAYHQATIGLQKQKLRNASVQAAMKVSAQKKLAALTASGVPMDKAILQVPELLSAGAETALLHAATRAGPSAGKMSDIDRLKYTAGQKQVQEMEKSGQNRLSTGFLGMGAGKENPDYTSAKQAMTEIEKRYAPKTGGVTHRYNPETGKIEEIKGGQ